MHVPSQETDGLQGPLQGTTSFRREPKKHGNDFYHKPQHAGTQSSSSCSYMTTGLACLIKALLDIHLLDASAPSLGGTHNHRSVVTLASCRQSDTTPSQDPLYMFFKAEFTVLYWNEKPSSCARAGNTRWPSSTVCAPSPRTTCSTNLLFKLCQQPSSSIAQNFTDSQSKFRSKRAGHFCDLTRCWLTLVPLMNGLHLQCFRPHKLHGT